MKHGSRSFHNRVVRERQIRAHKERRAERERAKHTTAVFPADVSGSPSVRTNDGLTETRE